MRRTQALECYGAVHVRRMVRRGLWSQPNPHVVVQHNGPLTYRQRLWVTLFSAPRGTVLAGITALSLAGYRGHQDVTVHLLSQERSRRTDPPGAFIHLTYVLPEAHVNRQASPPRTCAARSVVDAAAWARTDRLARGIVLGAIRQGVTDTASVRQALDVRLRQRRGRLIREALVDAEGGIQSVPEHDFDRLIKKAALPAPNRQRKLRRPNGTYYLDADYERYGLSVEIDGAPHTDVLAGETDAEREHQLVISGRRVLRFSAWLVRHRPEYVAGILDEALRAGGWRGSPALWVPTSA